MSEYASTPVHTGDTLPAISDPDGSVALVVFHKSQSDVGGDKRGLYVARDSNTWAAVAPVGSAMLWFTNVAPLGWLLLDGSAISRTDYADLFDLFGTTYGSGDGSTTFNLPDLRGRVPVGFSSGDSDFGAAGATGGEKTHQLTVSEMPSHTHTILKDSGSGSSATTSRDSATSSNGTQTTSFAGSDGSHNNLQPFLVVNYIVKT